MAKKIAVGTLAPVSASVLFVWISTPSWLPAKVLAQGQPTPAADPKVLPVPEPPFRGVIGRTVKESKPDFPKEVQAPAGAPNVLLILTDDVGFGASSTFGGPIPT